MRIKVADEQAIHSLIKRGARHRMVIAWWHLQDFRRVTVTPGHDHARPDRNALTIELFAQYMGQLEVLEMVYFAFRDKARDPSRSFMEHFEQVHLSEYFAKDTPPTGSYSAERILVELEGMDVERFQRELGMPSYDELLASACGKALPTIRASRERYDAYILEQITWMRDALANKRRKDLHRAYMKLKHGSIVLADSEDRDVLMVQDTHPCESATCFADVMPLDTTEEFAAVLAEETEKVGWTVIHLLALYLRRSPFELCEGCTNCDDREPIEETRPVE